MKCKVCGNNSGNYPLCRACNIKKNDGDIIKCTKCGNWHYKDQLCTDEPVSAISDVFLYEAKASLISKNESEFFISIKNALPEGYLVFPQVNLASFISRTDNPHFINELFRNVDFLITDATYKPLIVIEINDQTHLSKDRRKRDEKVKSICEEAGIPIINLWTSYGINSEYINQKISNTINALPVKRIHNFDIHSNANYDKNSNTAYGNIDKKNSSAKSQGCYIATCVYGSYDCPQVWTLRHYRDEYLSNTWYGKIFIKLYYAISPKIVELFGKRKIFLSCSRKMLDRKVNKLKRNGFTDEPYYDRS